MSVLVLKIMKKMKDFLPSNPMKKGVAMPSPNQLKRKILLKHKRLKADVEKTEMELFLKVRENFKTKPMSFFIGRRSDHSLRMSVTD